MPASTTSKRDGFKRSLGGSHDIAKAAELLHAEGAISYWQNPGGPNDTTVDDVAGSFGQLGAGHEREATKVNCFDFVHLCNHLSCCETHVHGSHFGNKLTALLDTKQGFNKWDGKSEIPRGSVIVATTPLFGDPQSGIYHVGVSTGDGTCISNRSGTSVTKEPVKDCFGSIFYNVYYGPYPHCPCHPDDAHETAPAPAGPIKELPGQGKRILDTVVKPTVAAGIAGVLLVVGGGAYIASHIGPTAATGDVGTAVGDKLTSPVGSGSLKVTGTRCYANGAAGNPERDADLLLGNHAWHVQEVYPGTLVQGGPATGPAFFLEDGPNFAAGTHVFDGFGSGLTVSGNIATIAPGQTVSIHSDLLDAQFGKVVGHLDLVYTCK